MAPPLALFGLDPQALLDDVYFRADFLALHAHPDACDRLDAGDFRIGAAVRAIPGPIPGHTWPGQIWYDLETPHGYGGPVARDRAALEAGLAGWRARQRVAGRVAEFIRLHPCLNPEALTGLVDHLAFNRLTVMVDLRPSAPARRAGYSQSTRRFLRHAEKVLTVRRLGPTEGPLFQRLYDAMLERHGAEARYAFPPAFHQALLEAPWCRTWVAEQAGEAVAASCFLATPSPVAHYHLGGGTEAGLRSHAQFLLFETAFEHFAAAGQHWLHLGGGRTPSADDSLWHFKTRFSPVQARFHVAGLIHTPDRFAALGGSRDGRFLGWRG